MNEPSPDAFRDLLRRALHRLCDQIDRGGRASDLRGIGLATSTDMVGLGAYLLFEGDLPADAEPWQRLSPVEWRCSEEDAFKELNQYFDAINSLPSRTDMSNDDFEGWVHAVFETCADVLEPMELRARYHPSLFLTFCAVDLTPLFEAEEKAFVKRLNSPIVFAQWCEAFD